MSYDSRNSGKRISNSLRSMAKALGTAVTINTSSLDAGQGTLKTLQVSGGKKRLNFYIHASRNPRTRLSSVSFSATISPKSSRRCQKNAPGCYSQTEGLPQESERDQDRIANLFLSAIRAGNSTCSRGEGSRFAHKFVTASKSTTGNVIIFSPDGCTYVILDPSGNVLYSRPSIREIGIDPSLLSLRMTRSKQAKQTEV